MLLELYPQGRVENLSFRFDYYLGKDKTRNCFFMPVTGGPDPILKQWLLEEGHACEIVTYADMRKANKAASQKKAIIQDRLTMKGASLFNQAYQKFGPFNFCFVKGCFIDKKRQPKPPSRTIKIDGIAKGFIINIGQSISVI